MPYVPSTEERERWLGEDAGQHRRVRELERLERAAARIRLLWGIE
jgi:hypothetical protein